MVWVVVLLRGFVELILSFCCSRMCPYVIEECSEAAYLVLCGVIAVVI